MGSSYGLMVGAKGQERLEILNEICNPLTLNFLRQIGVHPGSKILDIGCGLGIMSRELANLAGQEGQVHAVDISSEQIEIAKRQAPNNITFEVIAAEDLISLNETFDFIYTRFVLSHLDHSTKIIESIYSQLKRGGIVICEELCGSESFFCYPPSKAYEGYVKAFSAQFKLQSSDPSIGIKIPYLFSNIGLQKIAFQVVQPILFTSREKKLLRLGVKERSPAILESKLMDESELEAIQKELEDFEQENGYGAFVRYSQAAYIKI